MDHDEWPRLPLEEWRDTYATLHLFTQIIGMVRLKLASPINHWWNSALYVSTRGLRTSPIPFQHRAFEIELDFIDHLVSVHVSDGRRRAMSLSSRPVAQFHREFLILLQSLGIEAHLDAMPKEIPNPIPFALDQSHATYEPEYAHRFWRILVQADRLFNRLRAEFIGKSSPVHFFWGSFDLALSRFSGRRAPERPGADHITRVAYSHEVISCGFWPGSANIAEAAFYAYAAPEPEGFRAHPVAPAAAFYNPPTRGFILRYEDVRKSRNPDETLLEFCQSAYDAAATLGNWDRAALEKDRLAFEPAA